MTRWAFVVVLLATTAAGAAERAAWRIPTEKQLFDFTDDKHPPRHAFLDDGMALELSCSFLMLQHAKIAFEAILPSEPGEFKVQQGNPRALVEVTDVKIEEGKGRAEVAATFRPMTWLEVERTAKKKIDEIKDLPQAFKDVTTRHERWIAATDASVWRGLGEKQQRESLRELAAFDVADEYLRRLGIELETNRSNYKSKLKSHVESVYPLVAGTIDTEISDAPPTARGLSATQVERLREALEVRLTLRFFPKVDAGDANGQWFHAQRVGCRAKGVASIRLEGHLDPGKQDRVDWWFLEGFAPGTVALVAPKGAGFRVDPPYARENGALLRVTAAGDRAVEYTIELRPVGPPSDGLQVVIPETPAVAEAQFPF
jgi:hypothetical protein